MNVKAEGVVIQGYVIPATTTTSPPPAYPTPQGTIGGGIYQVPAATVTQMQLQGFAGGGVGTLANEQQWESRNGLFINLSMLTLVIGVCVSTAFSVLLPFSVAC